MSGHSEHHRLMGLAHNLVLVAAVLLPSIAHADPKLVAPFRDAEIVILGEIHDNPTHHDNQAAIVRALQPDALVFEMVEPRYALAVTPETREDAETLAEVLGWHESGWPDFAMYFPVFAAAPDAAVFGGGATQSDVRRAVTDGAAAVFGDASPLFGLDRPLDDAQLEERTRIQDEAHCGALPADLLPGMIEAQRLRDAALAKAAVAALEHARASGDRPQVVIVTGNGHARDDWGVPQLLRTYFGGEPEIDIRTLGQFEITRPDSAPFTTWIATDPPVREDPCTVFER